MTKSVKIGIGIGIVGVSIGAYFLVQYLILKNRYSTTLSASDASTLIDQKTSTTDDTIIPDDISSNADSNKGTSVIDDSDSSQNAEILSGTGDY